MKVSSLLFIMELKLDNHAEKVKVKLENESVKLENHEEKVKVKMENESVKLENHEEKASTTLPTIACSFKPAT